MELLIKPLNPLEIQACSASKCIIKIEWCTGSRVELVCRVCVQLQKVYEKKGVD